MDSDPFTRITALYHFTDTRNLALIRKFGGLMPLAALREAGCSVPAPGGNEWSQDADSMFGMDRYVHLSFCNSHPMEYLARMEGRIQETIFLKIDPVVLTMSGVQFTEGVSNKSGMTTHTLETAKDWIDFEVICTRMDWKVQSIRERRKAAEKCEILVPHRIPLSLIRNMPNG